MIKILHKTSLVLNFIVVALSLLLFGYTFYGKTHLVNHTRGFLIEKTVSYSKPLMESMKSGFSAPVSQKLITEKVRTEIQNQFTAYESNPAEYISSLIPKTKPSKPSFGVGMMADFKQQVYDYYQSVLRGLIRDLRIFSSSNIVAGIFALFILLMPSPKEDAELVIVFSFIIFTAVLSCTYSYLEGLTFLNILFKSYLGWWYPIGILGMIRKLARHYGLIRESMEKSGLISTPKGVGTA